MSLQISKASTLTKYAALFDALGDTTRLSLVERLGEGQPRSISQLAKGSKLTRQAVTKHLHVLERAGVVRSEDAGRERHFTLEAQPFADMQEYLAFVSERWDEALMRLKSFVED